MKYIYHCLTAIFCFTSSIVLPQNVHVTSEAPSIPLLKGISVNPFIRLEIDIPAQKKELRIKSIQIQLNNAGIMSLEKLEVYSTDTSDIFSSKKLITTIVPSVAKINLFTNITLPSGKQYLWISATVKNIQTKDNKIELHVSNLKDESNNIYHIKEIKSEYTKRIGVAVRRVGEDSVHTYRIPGITTTNLGTLIAVFDIRYLNSKDLPGNIDIGMSRSSDGGITWQPMKVILTMGEPKANNGVGDPSILFDPVTNKIWVAALWSKGNHSIAGSKPGLSPDESGQLILVNSSDDGLTWSAPMNITAQVKNPEWKILFQGPGNGIAMQNGTLVFPAQYWDTTKIPYSTIIYSTNHGINWKTGTGAKSNTTESEVAETIQGTLMLNMRDNRGGFRSVSTTNDMGKSWTEHTTSRNILIDPICQGSLIKASVKIKGVNKEVLFFSNANSSHKRDSITIKASLDYGVTWLPENQLLIDERNCYGYSSLTKIDENTIGLLYEGVREIYFVRVPVNQIIK